MKIERFSTEKLLTTLPKEWIMSSLRVSPDGMNVSYQIRKTIGKAIRVNEFTHPKYDEVTPVFFSPDSQHAVYAASQKEKQFIVVDGHSQHAYPYVYINTLAFLNESDQLAYAVQRNDEKFSFYINGEEEGSYENVVRTPLILDAKKNYAYLVEGDTQQSIILNGKTHCSFDSIDSMAFTGSAKGLKYVYTQNGMQYLTVDGSTSEGHDVITEFAHAADWSAYVYAADDNFKCVVIDSKGNRWGTYDEVKHLVMSEDGKHVAFAVRLGAEWFVVLDGEAQEKFDGIGEIKFSPNGERLAYKAMRYQKGFLKKVSKSCVVLDGICSDLYEGIGRTGFNFSADSKRFAYSAINEQHSFGVIDGRETIRYDGIGANTPFFSPEDRHCVLVASVVKKLSVLIDEEPGEIYKSIVMRDGGGVQFSAVDAFHYIALVDEELYLVEEKITKITE
jgi:hypothetical protein